MSYILDALKRADAERERGQVPGLHSQTAHAPAQESDTPVRHPRPADRRLPRWAWAASALAAALASGFWFSRDASVPPASAPPVTTPPPPVVAPVVTAPSPAPAPTPATLPETMAPAPPILAPAPPIQPSPAPATPAPVTATPQKAGAKADKVLPFGSLSAEQRAQLPQLNISGASYSDNPAHRLLIVNGQVLQEGQEVAPGLVLERIGPHEAVLNQRGLRLSIGY